MLVGAQLLDIRLMQVLGVSLATMAFVSVAIFEFAIRSGVRAQMEKGHVRIMKGEEYETVLAIESRGGGWIGSEPTAFVGTGQQMQVEPLSEGKLRLRFLGKYAGRMEGVKVGISLTDPLNLLKRLDEVVYTEFVIDTLPLSLLAPVVLRKQTVFGWGEQPTGYPGPGQELYGLEVYQSAMDAKNIIWKRVAKSPDEMLVASLREASVRDVVRVGVVQFAERGEGRAEWIDKLCEALGQVGKEVFEMGVSVTINYDSPRGAEAGDGRESEEGRPRGLTQRRARDVDEFVEIVMSCSVASASRDIEAVVGSSDFLVTGLRELEDDKLAMLIAERPLLLIPEEALPPPSFTYRSVIWTGKQNLSPLIRKIVEG